MEHVFVFQNTHLLFITTHVIEIDIMPTHTCLMNTSDSSTICVVAINMRINSYFVTKYETTLGSKQLELALKMVDFP